MNVERSSFLSASGMPVTVSLQISNHMTELKNGIILVPKLTPLKDHGCDFED